MNVLNPYLELSYPLLEISLWFSDPHKPYQEKVLKGEPQSLREEVISRFDAFDLACLEQGLAGEDLQNIKYALTAFIDESALKSEKAEVSDAWRLAPLQMAFFGEHMAGEGFFNKLTELRQSANSDVLEIYYLCLQLGFKGIYAITTPEKLVALQVDLRAQLEGLKVSNNNALSIDIYPEEGLFNKLSKTIPAWVFSSVFVCLIFIFYFVFSMVIDNRVKNTNKRINEYALSHAHFKKITP